YRYMTVACDALAKGTLGLHKILELPIVVGERVVSLPRNVLHIRQAKLQSDDREVVERNANRMQRTAADDYGSFGTLEYTRDYERRALVLSWEPDEADVLEAQCSVTVATPLSAGMPLPFLDIEDQQLLLYKMQE